MSNEINPMDYTIDLDDMLLIYECGFVCDITDLLDDEGEYTDDPEEAYSIVARVPGSGWINIVIPEECDEPTFH